jgi:hypothetical protein
VTSKMELQGENLVQERGGLAWICHLELIRK